MCRHFTTITPATSLNTRRSICDIIMYSLSAFKLKVSTDIMTSPYCIIWFKNNKFSEYTIAQTVEEFNIHYKTYVQSDDIPYKSNNTIIGEI